MKTMTVWICLVQKEPSYFGWIDVTLAKRAFLVIAYSVHALHAIRTQDVSTAKRENVLVHCQFIANWTHRHALE